jgi:hypothetical protein
MFHQDGRCATDAETIYVKNPSTCTGGAGTFNSPYCDPQAAVNAVTATTRLIVMKGPATDAFTGISATPAGKQISIIGQAGATTAAGAAIGVHITGGDIYIRGLTVANGVNKAGIVVEAGAILRMDRCIVKGNAGGGLIVQSGANFDIANSIFDGNGPGSSGPTRFGGVYLGGSAPSTGPNKFWFSSVVNNTNTGVVCSDTTQALSGMLLTGSGAVVGDYFNCLMNKTSAWQNGADAPDGTTKYSNKDLWVLDSADHLTANHYCRDLIDPATPHPFDDIDGQTRPQGLELDCGADEYMPPGQ